MTQKKKRQFKLVKPPSVDELRRMARKYWTARIKKITAIVFFSFMVVSGTYLLLTNHVYSTVYKAASYKKTTSDSNQYAAFGNGIVRYSRDGVAYLNHKNEELWIQSGQFKNPVIDIAGNSFAIGDSGGNSIQIFTEKGLKGEIETTLPIEKMSVSDQGIVSAILKNENTPSIVTYDATGNILVENQVSVSNMGYPVALEMSPNGTVLAVTYLNLAGGALKSKVVCYNFDSPGENKANHQVSEDEFKDTVMPEIYFMDASHMVVVGDSSFVLYAGEDVPEKKKEIKLPQEIKNTFHTSKYIGFVLLNEEKSGYEVRLYNKSGKMIMNREISGEYSNVSMVGDEIIMYDGSRCCIITKNGIQRLKTDLKLDALAVIPVNGINKYLVMSANELRVIYLAK